MGKEYDITKATGRCSACGKEMMPGDELVATVRPAPEEADEQFVRRDFCPACWDAADEDAKGGPEVFGTWRSRVPAPKDRKRTFVDDELLTSFFERLEGSDEPARVRFRFVLALILMRKRLLVYDRSEPAGEGRELWTMHLKGSDRPCEVIDPHLDEEQIAEVSQQLGEILEGEL
jgi:hypothetical protein